MPSTPSRVNALERALRSRNRLLEEPRPDPHWLDAIEHETAELAVAVAAQRAETVRRLQAALARARRTTPFPSAEIALDGWMEKLLAGPSRASRSRTATARVLRDNRARDAAAGPHARRAASHRSRGASMPPKGIPAADASTGEQKALLIGLVLAHAGLLAEMTGFAPVLLLDEVVAHLDPGRRAALYDALDRLGAQVWMTGADPAAFADVDVARRGVRGQPGPCANAQPLAVELFAPVEVPGTYDLSQAFNLIVGRGQR